MTENHLLSSKARLRCTMLQKRTRISRSAYDRAAERLCVTLCAAKQPRSVAVYLAHGKELSLDLYISWCWEQGIEVLVPQTFSGNSSLLFAPYRQDTTLEVGSCGIIQPQTPGVRLEDTACDVVYVPCLCIDKQGYRLGSGRGYYDRALSGVKVKEFVYVAYAEHEVVSCYPEPHDIKADRIVFA